MLDYLKMVSSILIVLLIISVSFASTPPSKPKIEPLFDKKCEKVLIEMGNEVANIEWDFQAVTFKSEIEQLEKILKRYNIKFDDYYLAVMKFIAQPKKGESYFIIAVQLYLKGIEGDWTGKWTIIQGDDTIIEELEKIENNRLLEKQYL